MLALSMSSGRRTFSIRIFFASPAVLADPGKKLEGEGKGMRMLKVRRPEDIDSASIVRWLKATVAASST